jgi:lipopolysaccharide export system permease protein
MRVLRRYLARQILGSVALVLVALLMLFAFFDLLTELDDVGQGRFNVLVALGVVLLSVPGRLYELFPVAVLIGTLFALARLVLNSEYAVMRASGVSAATLGATLAGVGLVLATLAFVSGEFLTPVSEEAAQRLRLQQTSNVVASQFRSGLWVKDDDSFVNVARILHDTTLQDIRIYRFDPEYRLLAISQARSGRYKRENVWQLQDVVVTKFEDNHTTVERMPQWDWHSVLTPRILSVLLVPPEKMSIVTLYSYVRHLRENRQEAGRYEIALWTKFIYPLAVVVMMVLALPFSYINAREGGVSVRIFIGIMLGLTYHVVSRLFGHLGALAAWPPMLAAFAPTVLFLTLALGLIYRLERR